jgi:beta-xylosidase
MLRSTHGGRILLGISVWLILGAAAMAQRESLPRNPILAGDHPDPTIVRIGKTYWTTSTSGDWAPEFTLYRSTDLAHWRAAGAVFPHPPAWAHDSFWAPEMVAEEGRVLVYYVARKREGPLCVGVATAATPAGPYEDHGPVVCQEDGSIDPAFARDEAGKPFLIWKEDGNSRNQPTRIWAQPLAADLVHLTGEKTELLENDAGSWEGGVIEAPYVLRHNGLFYMFYAGNACCGTECHYAEGVARASHLLGPWTRDPANPVIAANGSWRCPGHGTAVRTPAGRDLFLYHAYPAHGSVYLGRESVLDAISWNGDGWPVVNGGRGPGERDQPEAPAADFTDAFDGMALDAEWKWPVGHEPRFAVGAGRLTLFAKANGTQAFVARSLVTPEYAASVGVLSGGQAAGGLGLIGDAMDDVVLVRDADGLELWQSDRDGGHTLWRQALRSGEAVWLRVESTGNGEARFSYRVGQQGEWSPAGGSISLKRLLPWDSGLRVGLVVRGSGGEKDQGASFVRFRLSAGHL